MPKTVNVRVTYLDAALDFCIPKSTTGRQLYEQVTKTIGLQETQYFGLQFVNNKGFLMWIKDQKKVTDQNVKKEVPLQFKLKVKIYPERVKLLKQDVTRKLFLLHVKDLILSNDIECPPDTAALLTSYTVQDKEETMMEYLKIAQDLQMFGVTYFEIKDEMGNDMWLGVHALGLNIYGKLNKQSPHLRFLWTQIERIIHTNEKIHIKMQDKTAPDFKCSSSPLRTNNLIVQLCVGNALVHRHQ